MQRSKQTVEPAVGVSILTTTRILPVQLIRSHSLYSKRRTSFLGDFAG